MNHPHDYYTRWDEPTRRFKWRSFHRSKAFGVYPVGFTKNLRLNLRVWMMGEI